MRNPLSQPGAGWIIGGGAALFGIWLSYNQSGGETVKALAQLAKASYNAGAKQAAQSLGAGMAPNMAAAPSSSPVGATGGGLATDSTDYATGAVNNAPFNAQNTAALAVGSITGNYYTITPGGQAVQQTQGGYPTP